MELKAYWKLLRRRWLLVIVPAVVVLALGLATYRPAPPAYNAGLRFIVGQPPSPAAAAQDEERYYNWLTSEYIVNGLADWVRGGEFAAAVSAYLMTQGYGVPPELIQGGLAADNVRSMLTLSLTAGDAELLRVMLQGVVVVLQTQNAQALPQLGGETAVIIQLDQPVINPIPSGIRRQLDLPLRVALALAAGVGLALLVHYLDPTIQDRAAAEAAGMTILGEIPRQ
jgi:capsular polysaccharide biosynthesis protein